MDGTLFVPAAGPFPEIAGEGTVHFMGIGGAGMCSLAEAMARAGLGVSGCDLTLGTSVDPLRALGIPLQVGHAPEHLEGVEALILTSAVPTDHPELLEARRRGIPVLKRAEALGRWTDRGQVVAIAGTHGKTTTTAMTTQLFAAAGRDPTGFVGGWVPEWGGHYRAGRDTLFIVEADEYDRSFHHLHPTVAVITNLEPDHLDIYGDFEGVLDGFRTFLRGSRPGAVWLYSSDDPGARTLLAGVAGARSFGLATGSDLQGVDLDLTGGRIRMTVVEDGMPAAELRLGLPGVHNARNALAAAGAARALGVEWSVIASALAGFQGVVRRFQELGVASGVTVVDDYAHHPTELAAALRAARERAPEARLVAVFQPHLYTRTRDFAEEFARVLATADLVWLTGIYPAREPAIPGIDGEFLARKVIEVARELGREGVEVFYHESLQGLAQAVAESLRSGDLCMTLGAGSIEAVGLELLSALGWSGGGPHA